MDTCSYQDRLREEEEEVVKKYKNNKGKNNQNQPLDMKLFTKLKKDGMTGIIVSPDSNLKRSEFNLIDIDLDNALGLDTFWSNISQKYNEL